MGDRAFVFILEAASNEEEVFEFYNTSEYFLYLPLAIMSDHSSSTRLSRSRR